MTPQNPWPAEFGRVFSVVAVSAVAGLLTGYLTLFLLLGAVGYLGWHYVNVVRLERWLRRSDRLWPPESRGVWGELFHGLRRRKRHQRAAQRRLIALLKRFKETANAVPDATVVLGGHEEMLWWNESADRLLGLRWPQDEGQRIGNLFRHPKFSEYVTRREYSEAVTLPSPTDEQTLLEIRIVPYGQNQKLLLARDVTRLVRLERTRRDFVANISHELRTPLTVIHGLAETLADTEAGPSAELSRPLALILQQTKRMGRLVDDLLLLSRLESENKPRDMQVVDVPQLLRGLADEADALSDDRKHRIRLEADGAILLKGDESELRSAFANLIFNAVKYTPAGGEIGIRWWADPKGVYCAVTDTGVGIPAHHISRLTERFYRVDSGRSAKTGGTGLGLAIVKHVLSRHQGQLHISSRPGSGSRFVCEFPLSQVERRKVAVH